MSIAGNLIMIFFAIVQRMAMRLTYGARGPQPDDKVYFALSVLNWLLFIGAAVPILVVMPWWIGLLIVLLIMGAIDEGLRASRQLQRQINATLLSLAAERGLPLAGAVFRHATDQGGSVGRATRRLIHDLERGEGLSAAIRRRHKAVPREAVAYAEVGEAIEDRSAALAEASRQPPSILSGLHRLLIDRIGYLALLSVFMFAVVTFMTLRMVPQFSRMLEEFDVPMPAATELLLIASDYIAHNALVLAPLLLFALLAMFFAGILSLCGIPVFRSVTDRLMPGRHRAVVLRSLALAAGRGQPFEPTLAALAKAYPSTFWRRRLKRAHRDHRRGTDWSDALLRARIVGKPTSALVRAGQRVGNLAWTLRTAADREETREAYRWTAWVQVAFPVLMLACAAIVGFLCYSLFAPLVELIHYLAPSA